MFFFSSLNYRRHKTVSTNTLSLSLSLGNSFSLHSLLLSGSFIFFLINFTSFLFSNFSFFLTNFRSIFPLVYSQTHFLFLQISYQLPFLLLSLRTQFFFFSPSTASFSISYPFFSLSLILLLIIFHLPSLFFIISVSPILASFPLSTYKISYLTFPLSRFLYK